MKIWKELLMVWLRYNSGISLEGLEKNVSDETNFYEISFEQNEIDWLSHYSGTAHFPNFMSVVWEFLTWTVG